MLSFLTKNTNTQDKVKHLKLKSMLWFTAFYCGASSINASLMMSSDEVNILDSINPVEEIDSFFEATEIPKLTPSIIEDVLFLSTILYINQSHWTVWINEKTYTADDAENETLKITKVTSNHIEFELKDMIKKITKLRVNQSLVTIGHRITDGDARVKSKPVLL